jgi:hypothetical protein
VKLFLSPHIVIVWYIMIFIFLHFSSNVLYDLISILSFSSNRSRCYTLGSKFSSNCICRVVLIFIKEECARRDRGGLRNLNGFLGLRILWLGIGRGWQSG